MTIREIMAKLEAEKTKSNPGNSEDEFCEGLQKGYILGLCKAIAILEEEQLAK